MTSETNLRNTINDFGQPVGFSLENWIPPPIPVRKMIEGNYCKLEPLKAKPHAEEMWNAQADDSRDSRWTYMPFGPFADLSEFEKWGLEAEKSDKTQFFAVIVDGHAVGFVCYTNIQPTDGVVEVGVYYTSELVKTRAATEAMYLAIANAFGIGYRRFEWRCDSNNLSSKGAATRFGFTYEGLFRQALVYRGRNRDTTCFAIIDSDWENGLKDAFKRWLDASNFDDEGKQKMRLSELTAPFVHAKP
eukprot:jgi/Phyca11/102612/e_gw1.7.95.1